VGEGFKVIRFFAELWRDLTMKRTDRLNTLNMHGDLDDVEFLMALEDHFTIKVSDSEADEIVTMGDAHGVISGKVSGRISGDEVWSDLCKIAREFTVSEYPCDKETTFFAKHAVERCTAK
jgi:acyl carrier protein